MKIQEMVIKQKLIVQIVCGERVLEFNSKVTDKKNDGIVVEPYLYKGEPLVLNINTSDGVICNVWTNDPNNNRIGWKNIEITTVQEDEETYYLLSTKGFNSYGTISDRRKNERLIIRKNAKVYDPIEDSTTDIIVHDISDAGISFNATAAFQPASNRVFILLEDSIDEREFKLKIECSISRSQKNVGILTYGCQIIGENKDYLIYDLLKRIKSKSPVSGQW